MSIGAIIGGLCVSAVVGGLIGSTKGKAGDGVLFSLLFGPLGWVYVLLAPDRRPKCPACLGPVNAGARRCKNCGERLPEEHDGPREKERASVVTIITAVVCLLIVGVVVYGIVFAPTGRP